MIVGWPKVKVSIFMGSGREHALPIKQKKPKNPNKQNPNTCNNAPVF